MENQNSGSSFLKTLMIVVGVVASIAAVGFAVSVLLKKFKTQLKQFNEESADCSGECDDCETPCDSEEESKANEPECVFVD